MILYRAKSIAWLFCFMIGASAQAQIDADTLLFRNFQTDTVAEVDFPDPDIIRPNQWINWDQDGIRDITPNFPGRWFKDIDFRYFEDSTEIPQDTNFVYASSSQLFRSELKNRNWLISPPVVIEKNETVLFWKSAPRQGPRYMDGYMVLLSKNGVEKEDFLDTLFRHAQMVEPLPLNEMDTLTTAFVVDSFLFAPKDGYIHADRYTIDSLFFREDTATFFTARLEAHMADISEYQGDTIHIAFLHDSDNDNFISIDDILITSRQIDHTTDLANEINLTVFPNPVRNRFRFLFNHSFSGQRYQAQLFDTAGKMAFNQTLINEKGRQEVEVAVGNLPPGLYYLCLDFGAGKATRKVVVH